MVSCFFLCPDADCSRINLEKGENDMVDYRYCDIRENHSFFDINKNPVCINWKGKNKIEEDLYDLSEAYFYSAYEVFEEILDKIHDNVKLDMWFIPGVYMFRQSLVLQIISNKNNDIVI